MVVNTTVHNPVVITSWKGTNDKNQAERNCFGPNNYYNCDVCQGWAKFPRKLSGQKHDIATLTETTMQNKHYQKYSTGQA